MTGMVGQLSIVYPGSQVVVLWGWWRRWQVALDLWGVGFRKVSNITKWALVGHSRWLLMAPFDRPRYDFLLVFHCDHVAILYRFQNVTTNLLKKGHVSLITPHMETVCYSLAATCHVNPTCQIWNVWLHHFKTWKGIQILPKMCGYRWLVVTYRHQQVTIQ